MDANAKRVEFEPLIPAFEGRPVVVVEFGPECHLARVEGITAAEGGVAAKLVWEGVGPPPEGWDEELFATWDLLVFDEEYWQVMYANVRIVFDADCVARTRRGDTGWLDDFF
jgi:hypothetical protein